MLHVSHAPSDYCCPFCAIAAGSAAAFTAWRGARVLVHISNRWYAHSPGHALVIPQAHYENVYALPDDLAGDVARTAGRVAAAMRRGYPCDGVTIRQNNEPAGGQDVWHLHTHVIPCQAGHRPQGAFPLVDDGKRARYAALLRDSLAALAPAADSTSAAP